MQNLFMRTLMQKSVSKASRYRQPLGFAGQISKGRHTHFQTYGAQCADSSVKLGKFVQYATSSASLHYDRATAVCGLVTNIKKLTGFILTGFNTDTRPIEVVWDANALDANGNPMISFNQYTGEYYAFDTILNTTKSQPYKATLIDKLTGDTIGYINFNRSSSRSTITPETDYSRVIKASEAIEACEGNPVIGHVLGLCIFHNLHASDTQGVGFKKGNTATIMRQGAAFIETDQQCNEGDYIFVSRNDGTLAFDSERNKDGYAYTGFGVLKGNKTAELGIIEIGTDMSWARGQIDWSDAVSVNAYNDGTNNVFQAYSDGKLMWEGTLTSSFALSATGFDVRMDGGNLKFTISDGKARINCALTNQPVILYSSGDSYAKITCDENSQTQIVGSGNAFLDIALNGGSVITADTTYQASITSKDNANLNITLNDNFASTTPIAIEADGNSTMTIVMNDSAQIGGGQNEKGGIIAADSAIITLTMNDNSKFLRTGSNQSYFGVSANGSSTMNLNMHDASSFIVGNYNAYAVNMSGKGVTLNLKMDGTSSITANGGGGNSRGVHTWNGTYNIEMSESAKITTNGVGSGSAFSIGASGNTSCRVNLTLNDSASVFNGKSGNKTGNFCDLVSGAMGGSNCEFLVIDNRAVTSANATTYAVNNPSNNNSLSYLGSGAANGTQK